MFRTSVLVTLISTAALGLVVNEASARGAAGSLAGGGSRPWQPALGAGLELLCTQGYLDRILPVRLIERDGNCDAGGEENVR